MSPATAMTLGVPWRPTRGPALRRSRLPLGLTLLSAGAHGALLGGVMLAAVIWPAPENKVYVVNLVPAVAGVGVPEAKPAPKAPPETKPAPRPPAESKPQPQPPPPVESKPEPKPAPRPPEPPPVAKSTPAELPQRSAALPARDSRSAAAEMPARQTARAPALPAPEPELPAAAPALTRPGEKEPPRVASARPPSPLPPLRQAPPAPPPPAPVPSPQPAAAPPAPAPAPPPPAPAAGRPSGSAAGSGAVTLEVTDFPYAYYLLAIQNKITERWQGRALDGRQPVATFQIDRNGRISGLAISKTSGNPYYDQAAMRAVLEAAPFPPLPQDFPGSYLRVHLGFNFSADRG